MVPDSLLPSDWALPIGITVLGGAAVSFPQELQGPIAGIVHSLTGPQVALGVELGDRFIHTLYAQAFTVHGDIRRPDDSLLADIDFASASAGYRFTFDLFGRRGPRRASPYLAAGILVGIADIRSDYYGGETENFRYELHVAGGARYRITDHLGLRCEVALSVGELVALQPAVGLYTTWGGPGG